MPLLLTVSLIWAFSFGLIKGRLAGLDPAAVAVVRLALAALVFLPLLRLRSLPAMTALRFAAIGALQFGAMYVFYLRAFVHLQAHEVALFTIFTPLYIALGDAALERRFQPAHVAAAGVSVLGAGLLLAGDGLRPGLAVGFGLVQLSNLCFALGQLAYKRVRSQQSGLRDRDIFGLLYAGAVVATGAFSLFTTDWSAFRPSAAQWGVLAYLGILASGLCFFWWNLGALRVNNGTLAAFNNAKVPLGVACSLLFFGESADLTRLAASLLLLTGAVLMAEYAPNVRAPRRASAPNQGR
jgi:drug/metabolite transporter (DMT)-like permease